jgi:hypothetical protein
VGVVDLEEVVDQEDVLEEVVDHEGPVGDHVHDSSVL